METPSPEKQNFATLQKAAQTSANLSLATIVPSLPENLNVRPAVGMAFVSPSMRTAMTATKKTETGVEETAL